MQQITLSEKWQMIDFATKHGARVTNHKGELVRTSKEYPDAVKCYASFPHYYLSSAESQILFFDSMTFDEWWQHGI